MQLRLTLKQLVISAFSLMIGMVLLSCGIGLFYIVSAAKIEQSNLNAMRQSERIILLKNTWTNLSAEIDAILISRQSGLKQQQLIERLAFLKTSLDEIAEEQIGFDDQARIINQNILLRLQTLIAEYSQHNAHFFKLVEDWRWASAKTLRHTFIQSNYRQVLGELDSLIANIHEEIKRLLSKNEVRQDNIKIIWIIISFFAILTGVAIGVGMIIRMISPINQFLDTASEIGKGNLNVHVDLVHNDEFQTLAKVFNDMTKKLNNILGELNERNAALLESTQEIEHLNQNLEQKVKDRTKQLIEKNEEVQNSLIELERTQQQLLEQKKHAALGQLVAGVGHEMNTPLGIALTAYSLICEKFRKIYAEKNIVTITRSEFVSSCETIDSSLELIGKNLSRLSELVNNFKLLSPHQSQDPDENVDINEVIRHAIGALKTNLLQQEKIQFSPVKSLSVLKTYPWSLSQVLTLLIDNAIIHGINGIEHGVIKISVKEKNQSIQILVSDNGHGMSAEEQGYIFDPFYTSNRREGVGLGMHIVYNIVTQKLKGKIECESELHRGTTFTIILPI